MYSYFQEMSRNLRALGNGSRSGHYPYYSQPAAADSSSSSVVSANRTSDYTAAAAVSECGTIHEEVAAAERLTETMTKERQSRCSLDYLRTHFFCVSMIHVADATYLQ